MKRWRILALAACLLLAGCGAGTQEKIGEEGPPVMVLPVEELGKTPEEGGEEDLEPDFTYDESGLACWQRGYADFLRALCKREAAVRNIDRPDYDPNAYPGEIGMLSEGYCLYDIDKDGVPELFIRCGNCEAAYHTYVYGWAGGAVAELGDFPSGHVSLYTWPGENAVALNWGHMGGHFVHRVSIRDGALAQEIVFEEDNFNSPEVAYTAMEDIVPGSAHLREVRTTLGLTFGAESSSTADRPLLLPVYDYGRERVRREIDPGRDAAARRAITSVLENGAAFYGASSDMFGGDTGWTTLERYLAPGGVDRYADTPQTVDRLAWLDMDGDGRTECLLSLRDPEGWPDQYVVLGEREGTVYAYCVNYCGDYSVNADGVFYHPEYGDPFALSFWKNQCYQCNVPWDETVPSLEWEEP